MDIVVNANSPLTMQEEAILKKVAQGLSNKSIANQLYLSDGTIRNYMSTILQKLNAENRTDAVRIAQENNWL